MPLKEALEIIPDDALEHPYKESWYVGMQLKAYYKQRILLHLRKVKKWIKKKQ